MMSRWPRKFKTYWCVIDGRGTAYMSSVRMTRAKSIAAWLADADKSNRGWQWWYRANYRCQKVDIKIRDSQS
jgi:hypothetical protein